MPMLDIFNNDAFGVITLSGTINEAPPQPSRLKQMGLFTESGIATTSIALERQGTTIKLVTAQPRGAVAPVVHADKPNLINLQSLHLPQRAVIRADEVQGVRAYGKETEVETVQNIVNLRAAKLRNNLDATLEWHRMGALRGQVLDADGTTVLHDLFSLFGVSKSTFSFALGTAATDLREKCVQLARAVQRALGGVAMITGVRVLCSPGFIDQLTKHADYKTRQTFRDNNDKLLDDYSQGAVKIGPVVFEEYLAYVGTQEFIPDGLAIAIPMGVSGLFETVFAPADYMETVNTIGLPYYANTEFLPMNKGVTLEVQSNPLTFCTRPQAVFEVAA